MKSTTFKSSRLSKVKIAILSSCLLVASAIAILMSIFPIQSVFWHVSHGSRLRFNGAEMQLPILWWRGADTGDGEVLIRHAKFNIRMPSEITVVPLEKGGIVVDDKAATSWQRDYRNAFHIQVRDKIVPVTIAASSVHIYCVIDTQLVSYNSLVCKIPNATWGISFTGSDVEVPAVESIIASVQLSN